MILSYCVVYRQERVPQTRSVFNEKKTITKNKREWNKNDHNDSDAKQQPR